MRALAWRESASGRRLADMARRAVRLVGLTMVAVWLPLLVAGISSLRSRGRFGDSDTLIITGPYACVRHPLYAGLSLTAAGTGLVLGLRRLVVAGLGWLLVTRLWSVHEEQALASRFGSEYEAYRQSTPAMIPDPACLVRLPQRIRRR